MANNTVTSTQFATGILAALARENRRVIATRSLTRDFEWALRNAYAHLQRAGATFDFEPGDQAAEIIRAIGGAVSSGLGELQGDGTLRITIDRNDTDTYFEYLPLDAATWRSAAKVIIERISDEELVI